MDVVEILSTASRLLLSLVALLAAGELLRRRDRTSLDVALMLASLGYPALVATLPDPTREIAWIGRLSPIAVIAQPFLLLRLVEDFRPVPRPVLIAGFAGMIVSWGAVLILGTPLPDVAVLGIVAYFLVFELYAVVALSQGARASRGVSRWRYGLAAGGSALLALTIALPRLSAAVPAAADTVGIVSAAIPGLVAVSYYLAFTSPRWLRQTWQLPEVRRFLRAVAGQPAAERAGNLLDELCATATRATGGVASAVFLWDEEQRSFNAAAFDHPALDSESFQLDDGPLTRAWNERRAAHAIRLADFGGASARLAASLGASALIAVPVATPHRAWGLLAVFQLRGSLFAADDIALLEILSEQCAIALDNADLVAAQQRQAEEERRLAARLEVSNRELEAFAYSVSHDLRAPLRGIDGFSHALLEDYGDRLDEQGQDYLNRVRAATQLMGRLIDDLLTLSRVTRSELRSERVDLTAVAAEIAAMLQGRDRERSAQFVIEDGVIVRGDPGLLTIALENLLDNAWKFTSGRPSATIEFGVDGQRERPVYFVRDNGAGFDMAYVDKLFGPFQRLHGSAYEGTGIGLATVQRIINRHGGRVWAEGAVERGATFYFTLEQG